ncbi:MAG TPA: tetratricopeptide repeat protein [Ktedonobacterales bacterium]|jgi:tetratricopeptide (TPR) repeat protein|nr:tetratricopeptide repeat protein [Ktedonobacterales bacterium]
MLASAFQARIVPSAAAPSRVASADAFNDKGVQSWQQGRRTEAVAGFNSACHADAAFAVPWHNRGAIYLVEGQFARAIPEFQKAVQLAPEWTLPRSHLAQAYLRTGNGEAALLVSDAARSLDPTLPDIRHDLRGVLQARAQIAAALAKRRLTYFIITLVITVVITVLTAGFALGSLALPIYRYILYAQATRVRDGAQRQLRLLDLAPAQRPAALPLLAAPPATARVGASGGAGVAAVTVGILPAFSTAELDDFAPEGTAYRRAGWILLMLSVFFGLLGVVLLVISVAVPFPPSANSGVLPALTDSGLSLLALLGALPLSILFAAIAVLVGAVAAFRRHRVGWAIAILLLGTIGLIMVIVPAQVVILVYLLAMPHTPASRGLDLVPVPQMSLERR